MRKHAGHGCLGIGAARAYGTVISQITRFLQLGQLGVGIAGIPAQRKIRSPRRFADHQHDDWRLFLGGVGCAEPGILANRLQHLLGTRYLISRQLAHAVQRVERIDQVTNILVVAHQGRHVLIRRQQHPHHHDHGRQRSQKVTPCVRPKRTLDQLLPEQPDHGNTGDQHQAQRQPPGQQVARLTGIRVHDVGHHRGVDHHTVLQHEIGAGCRGNQQQAGHHFENPGPGQQAEQGHRGSPDQTRKTGSKQQAAQTTVLGQSPQGAPQRHIAHCGQPAADHQSQHGWAPWP